MLVVDCLSLWVPNMLERAGEAAAAEARGSRRRARPAIAVTNEVGLGIVPTTSSRGATATRSAA